MTWPTTHSFSAAGQGPKLPPSEAPGVDQVFLINPHCLLQYTPLYLANRTCLFISWLVWSLKFGIAEFGREEFKFFLFLF